jgi:hypothetical protein
MNRDPRRELTDDEVVEAFGPDIKGDPAGVPTNIVSWPAHPDPCPHCGYQAATLDTRGLEPRTGFPIHCGRCHRHAFTVVADGIVTVVP